MLALNAKYVTAIPGTINKKLYNEYKENDQWNVIKI